MQKLVDPLFHSRSDFDILSALTRRFDRQDEYTRGMDEIQRVEKLYEDCRGENGLTDIAMPPFAEFWQKGYVLFPQGNPGCAMPTSATTPKSMR